MREIDFCKKTIRKQWELVNNWYTQLDEETFNPQEVIQELVRSTIELTMDLKRYRYLESSRQAGIWNKANGYYSRHLDTTFGSLEKLRVPRLRKDPQPQPWFGHYQRRWKKVDRLILDCLVGGLSCRRAVKIMNRYYNWSLSPSVISRLSKHLQEALNLFRSCPVDDDYVGLIIDGAWFRFRQLYGPKRVLLAVLGVRSNGQIVLLGFHTAKSESEMDSSRLLQNLKQRGLDGFNLRIFVADGASGFQSAAARVYPWATFQRCCWHNLQTLKYIMHRISKQLES